MPRTVAKRRGDGRRAGELRPITIRRGYLKNAEGSALIEMGGTRVLCAATVEERVPPFLRNTGRGWVTAEYSMLPRSSHERITREVTRGHVGGRTHEIQRLIGRSLRAVTRLPTLTSCPDYLVTFDPITGTTALTPAISGGLVPPDVNGVRTLASAITLDVMHQRFLTGFDHTTGSSSGSQFGALVWIDRDHREIRFVDDLLYPRF